MSLRLVPRAPLRAMKRTATSMIRSRVSRPLADDVFTLGVAGTVGSPRAGKQFRRQHRQLTEYSVTSAKQTEYSVSNEEGVAGVTAAFGPEDAGPVRGDGPPQPHEE